MCIAIPGKIKRIIGKKALIIYPDSKSYALIVDAKVKVGDYVLVQMGIIIKILSPAEYKKFEKMWK